MIDSATYSVAEAARVLGVGEMTVYRLIDAGELPAVVLRRRKRIPRRAIELVLDRALDGFDPDRLLAQLAGADGPSSAPAPASGIDEPARPPAGPAARGEGPSGPARVALVRT